MTKTDEFKIIEIGKAECGKTMFSGNGRLDQITKNERQTKKKAVPVGDGMTLHMEHSKEGPEMAVISNADGNAMLAFYVETTKHSMIHRLVQCGDQSIFACSPGNGKMILVNCAERRAASLYIGFAATAIESEAEGENKCVFRLSGYFMGSEYEEHIKLSIDTKTLECLGCEIDESRNSDDQNSSDFDDDLSD